MTAPFSPSKNTTIFRFDYWLLLIIFVILITGLLLLTSASMGISDRLYHSPFHFLLHQLIYIIVSIAVAIAILRIPIIFWEKIGGYLLLLSIVLLTLVLIPGIGHTVNGSIRWIGAGPFTLQVSEFAKFSIVIYMAGYLLRREDEVRHNVRGFIKPIVILSIFAGLLLMEPDFGATVVIVLTVLGMMFLAGARLWLFILLFIVVLFGLGFIAVASPYRIMRLTSFLNPWSKAYDSGYQLTQSLIAFGRGGIFGVGFGNSIQKLFYLPEAHTDFLFAVLAEELGIIGQIGLIGLFSCLIGRILYIGKKAITIKNNFAAYIAYGFGLLLAMQVMINIGVNTGILPTKGLTLPFISYGGSSMLFNCAIIIVLLRVYHEIMTPKNIM